MSDFPRGWTLTNTASGSGVAAVTVPAITGVVHVLDAIFAAGLWFGGAPGSIAPQINLTSSDGVFSNFPLGVIAVQGTAGAEGTDSDSSLDMAAGPGASLTIGFSLAAPAGFFQLIRVRGHDI